MVFFLYKNAYALKILLDDSYFYLAPQGAPQKYVSLPNNEVLREKYIFRQTPGFA